MKETGHRAPYNERWKQKGLLDPVTHISWEDAVASEKSPAAW